jgi:hypothetical protein
VNSWAGQNCHATAETERYAVLHSSCYLVYHAFVYSRLVLMLWNSVDDRRSAIFILPVLAGKHAPVPVNSFCLQAQIRDRDGLNQV